MTCEISDFELGRITPDAAHRFFRATKKSFNLLLRHPGLGRLRSFSQTGIRSFRVPGFTNYLVFYLPVQSEVQMLAVLHGACDLEKALDDRF
jgi:plasmid stabilization system protein ParE